jgi:N-methylhydantoinase B/oxoprolinase/acetone carboxylase alpha subunit
MRGGLGLRRDYRLLAEASDGMYYVEQTVAAFAARGREGGAAGRAGRATLHRAGEGREQALPGKGYIHLRSGDVLSLVGAGGGGFGAIAPDGGLPQNGTNEEEL